MFKHCLLTCISIMIAIILTGCNSKKEIDYNNDVFTSELYQNIQQVEYVHGDKTDTLTDEKDIFDFYALLASLELTPDDNFDLKCGHMLYTIKTNDETIPLGILSGEIVVGDTKYATNKDICRSLQDIFNNQD